MAGQKARVARQPVDKWLYYWLLITSRLIASSATRSRFGAEIGRFRTLGGWAGYCSPEPAYMWFHCCGRQCKQTINYIFYYFSFYSSCSSFLLLLLVLFHLLVVIMFIYLYLLLSLPFTINIFLCLSIFLIQFIYGLCNKFLELPFLAWQMFNSQQLYFDLILKLIFEVSNDSQQNKYTSCRQLRFIIFSDPTWKLPDIKIRTCVLIVFKHSYIKNRLL